MTSARSNRDRLPHRMISHGGLIDESVQCFRQGFEAFVSSDDGRINIAELKEMLRALGGSVPEELTIREMISLLRSNTVEKARPGKTEKRTDGNAERSETDIPDIQAFPNSSTSSTMFDEDSLDFEEFLRFMTSFFQVDNDEIRAKDVFRVFDINGDGAITASELAKILRKHFDMDLTLNEAKAMIEMAHDTNEDDLTLDEFKAFYKSIKSTEVNDSSA